ncbi:hypothetical protein GCM10010228_10480 [Streptomyces massasporeus]|nr:hypothetical protein GCM10010228_10480 [Streptomyces massasporeus]
MRCATWKVTLSSPHIPPRSSPHSPIVSITAMGAATCPVTGVTPAPNRPLPLDCPLFTARFCAE